MSFKKYIGSAREYQGESFTKAISKENGEPWSPTLSAMYIVYKENGDIAASGSLTKSDDGTQFILNIPADKTADFDGYYLILVELVDNGDLDTRDVIAEYNMLYSKRIPTKLRKYDE